MGSACCVAAKDRTTVNGSGNETLCRNIRYSPNWSFRWDNRGRVAGEETSINWFSDGVNRNDRVELKCESTYASEDGITNNLRTPCSDQSNSRNVSTDTILCLNQVDEATESPTPSYQSPAKLSFSLPSTSSLSSQTYLPPTSHRERTWSFDSDSYGEKTARMSSRMSTSSVDLQTCGVCSKLLTEKSSWSSQRIIANNELSVAAVLNCGHVYHAECLENMTAEIYKYDPACPVCTLGEKHTHKLSEKSSLKSDMDRKCWYRISKNCNADHNNFDGDYHAVNDHPSSRMSASSSMTSSSRKAFLKRHFSFGGSKASSRAAMLDNQSTRRKGFFWAKSSKV